MKNRWRKTICEFDSALNTHHIILSFLSVYAECSDYYLFFIQRRVCFSSIARFIACEFGLQTDPALMETPASQFWTSLRPERLGFVIPGERTGRKRCFHKGSFYLFFFFFLAHSYLPEANFSFPCIFISCFLGCRVWGLALKAEKRSPTARRKLYFFSSSFFQVVDVEPPIIFTVELIAFREKDKEN